MPMMAIRTPPPTPPPKILPYDTANIQAASTSRGNSQQVQQLTTEPTANQRLGRQRPSVEQFLRNVAAVVGELLQHSLWNHMFICAESPIFSDGHPSSTASSFRAAKLLSRPNSFSRSTIETFQLSFWVFEAASFSSFATTSTTAIGCWSRRCGGRSLRRRRNLWDWSWL